MSVRKPENVPLHNSRVDASNGIWLLHVDNAVESQSDDNLFLKLLLEQGIDDERFRMRRLDMLVFAPDLEDPVSFGNVVEKIRHWIETTEADGSLDMVTKPT